MTTKKAKKIIVLTELLAKELDIPFNDLFELVTDNVFEEDIIKLCRTRVSTDSCQLEFDGKKMVLIS